MESTGGQVALAFLIVMFGVFAFTTSDNLMRIGSVLAAAVVFAAVLRGVKKND